MSEQPDTRKELPPEIREFLINKLAEILVLDYRQTQGLSVPTDGEPSQKRGQPKLMKGVSHGTNR